MIKRNIPNTITLGNLLCGCLAIVKAFEGDLVWASYLVGIAAILDFFDGFAARMLKVSSPIGKDLDSLADMVTFGVVPGIIVFQMIKNSNNSFYLSDIYVGAMQRGENPSRFIAFMIPLFSAIRLAKFNNDTRQTESFIGLPTPANAIFICSFPLFLTIPGTPEYGQAVYQIISTLTNPLQIFLLNPYFLCLMSLIMSLLLVAPIPLFSLKFKKFGWKGNEIRYSFLIFSLVLLVSLQFLGIPLIILSYILFSVGNNLINRGKKTLS